MAWLTFPCDVDTTAKSLAYDAVNQPTGVQGSPKALKVVVQAAPTNTAEVTLRGAPFGASVAAGSGLVLMPGASLGWDAAPTGSRIASNDSWLFEADWSEVYAISTADDQEVSVTVIT